MILPLAFLAAFIFTLCLLIAKHDSKYRASYRGRASYDYNKETPPKNWETNKANKG